jgi:spore coat protein A, manganese oxidase
MSEVTRRRFLAYGLGAGASLVVLRKVGTRAGLISARSPLAAAQASPALTKFTEQLPIPPAMDLTGGGSPSLAMASHSSHKFHFQLGAAATFGYDGADYLGPTLLVRQGQPVSITFPNNLGAHPLAGSIDTTLGGAAAADKTTPRASVHVHGGLTPPQFDGHPEDTYLPGSTKTYNYLNGQEAATVWYHDHALGITRLNVYAGLAGYYLIRDQFDTGLAGNPLGLPAPYGTYELPLVLQDKTFNATGTLFYDTAGVNPAVHPQWVPEFFGDVAVVNGKAWPNLTVAAGLYRFRIVNGSDARFYNLRLSNGQPVVQVGTDGGLLNAPVNVGQLLLAPGERADVLIDFSALPNGTKVVLQNNARAPFPTGPRNKRKGGIAIPQLMQFTVDTTLTPFQGAVPATLRGGPGQPPAITPPTRPPAVRNLVLNEILDPATGFPLAVLLNNLHFDTANIETPTQGTTEMWNLINTTADTHPIHLHLVQFQLLERQPFDSAAYLAAFNPGLPNPGAEGQGPYPAPSADQFAKGAAKRPDGNEQGFKDTIRANPGEITRIVAKFPTPAQAGFDPDATYTNAAGQTLQGYVWHCHILEHEDNDMMLKYRVIP